MAKIAFFNERLPPDSDPVSGFSYELIRSLADQQHDVRVFSTYRAGEELPSAHPRIEIFRPFKSWSWLEVPRVIPLLMDFHPDIIHVIEPRAEALRGLSNAAHALPALAPLLNRPVLVSSYYDLRADGLKKHRFLLHSCDAVTVSNASQLKLLEDFFTPFSRSPELTLLPVPASISHEEPGEIQEAGSSSALGESDGTLIFVPGDIDSHSDPSLLFETLAGILHARPDVTVVFAGGWGRIPQRSRHELMRVFARSDHRVFITGRLSASDERRYLARAKIVFMASLPLESLWWARVSRMALEASALPIITNEQASFDALEWRHGENAWILDLNPNTWFSSLSEALSSASLLESMCERLPEFVRAEAIDQPSNVVSRLYAHLLNYRRKS